MYIRLLLAIDYLALLTLLYFCIVGMADASVTADNIGLWTLLIIGLSAIIGVGHWLLVYGKRLFAGLLLAIPAVPALLYALLMLSILIVNPNWQ